MDLIELRQIKREEYQYFYDPKNPDTLVALIKLQHFPHLNIQNKQTFANIIILPNAMAANIYKKSLLAMIRQPVASEVMIEQFCNLARFSYPKLTGQIRQFQTQTKIQSKEHKIVQRQHLLTEYVRQTFFHKLLNNLLRVSSNSFEIFYAHYFVQKMHYTIKQKYKSYDKSSKKFICYRGCQLTEKQINNFKQNQGKYIETLGFLSTSLSEKIALNFAQNAIFEIVITDDLEWGEFDQGFAYLNNPQMQVLFNVLCSFQILEVTTAKKHNLQILKVKLKYGELARLMSKYNKKQLINFSDIEKQIITSIAHQSFQTNPLNQAETFKNNLMNSINYFEVLLKLIEICPSYDPNFKKFFQLNLIDIKNKNQILNSDNFVVKAQKPQVLKQQGPINMIEFSEEISYLRNVAIESMQFQTRGAILVQRILKLKSSMSIMKNGIQKNMSRAELAKKIRHEIVLLSVALQIKLQLEKYTYDQVFKNIQELKQRIKFLFGDIHPYYTNVLDLQNQFQKHNVKKYNDVKTFQKWRQFQTRKQKSSPETLPKQYLIVKQFQRQAFLADHSNWKYNLSNQKYNKKVNNNHRYSSGLKQRIHHKLFQYFHRECGQLFFKNRFVQCQKLIKCLKNNQYYDRPFHDENLAKIKIHKFAATKMYSQYLQQMVFSDLFKTNQCHQYLITVMNNKFNNITMNLGKDSYLYAAHKCYHIFILKMLGHYQEAETNCINYLEEIVESPIGQQLRQFVIDQLKQQTEGNLI